MNIIYLAAGKSSRIFKDIKKPKCMVSLNNETLIENLLKKAPNKLTKYVITGFKSYVIKKYLKSKKIKNINFLYNKFYNSREMLYSMFFAMNKINANIIFSYSDISYERKIINNLIKKKSKNIVVPILDNWKQVWNQRKKNIRIDAEELLVDKKNKIILKIGTKLKKNFPKYQFMGIVYVPKILRDELIDFYKKKIINKNIHTTNFLQSLIENGFKIKYEIYTGRWYEFDDLDDYLTFKKNYTSFF